jgi:cytidine deaminase
MKATELINLAVEKLRPYETEDGRLHGDVAAALIGGDGKAYTGVCVDTPGWGLCAERSAIAAMITEGCYEIEKIAAVWRDGKTSQLYVLPPCGICRDFMLNISRTNLDAEIVLGKEQTKKLRELIPHHEWPEPLEGEESP